MLYNIYTPPPPIPGMGDIDSVDLVQLENRQLNIEKFEVFVSKAGRYGKKIKS